MFGMSKRHQHEVDELRKEVANLKNLVTTLTEKQLQGVEIIKNAETTIKLLKEEVSTKVQHFVEANEDYRRVNGQFKDTTVKRIDKVEKYINDERKKKQSRAAKWKNNQNKQNNATGDNKGKKPHNPNKKPGVKKGTVVNADRNGIRKLK